MQGQDAVIDGRDCDSVVDGDCGGDGPILERSNYSRNDATGIEVNGDGADQQLIASYVMANDYE